jgi:phosphoglycerate dehydrogenase-like enzyme
MRIGSAEASVSKILVDVPADEAALSHLRARGLALHVVEPAEIVRPLPAELLGDIDTLFCLYPPQNFQDMKKLRWIQIASAGYGQLFGLDLPSRQIRATNARGCFDAPIAEWNMSMMVNLARNLRRMIRNQETRTWERPPEFQREIRGLTVGIWGYGGIGRETARLARTMGMRVHVLSRRGVRPAGEVYRVPGTGDPEGVLPHQVFLSGQELEFLAGLDFLILAMPLTKATEGIIGEGELRALPRSAYVLNPARGPIIREQALLQALREGWIAGAALDTHYQYPLPPDHPLWQFPNVILTPHISGSTLSPRYRERIWDIFVQNVERSLAGRPLLNELTRDQLNGM